MSTIIVLAGLGGLAFWSSRVDYTLLYGKMDEGRSGQGHRGP